VQVNTRADADQITLASADDKRVSTRRFLHTCATGAIGVSHHDRQRRLGWIKQELAVHPG
jgi:hypothetical protein